MTNPLKRCPSSEADLVVAFITRNEAVLPWPEMMMKKRTSTVQQVEHFHFKLHQKKEILMLVTVLPGAETIMEKREKSER